MTESVTINAHIVDLDARRIAPSTVRIVDGRIADIAPTASADGFALPGFVDAHVHVESSMMVPSEFARFAVRHGTVGTVSDPHEIANVLGVDGVRFMRENGARTPFKFCWGAPSCVPATCFETAGATVTPADVHELFALGEVGYLSEVMNYPGVLAGDPDLLAKIAAARKFGKPVDGHAPGLRGDTAARYAAAGITTDHECVTLDEALDKIAAGMKILIREGSAARNFAALEPLLHSHPDRCMFCSDDLHPDALAVGHINRLVSRAIAGGADLFEVLRAACRNPVDHYQLPVGQLRVGDPADFIIVTDLAEFCVRETWIAGQCVFSAGTTRIARVDCLAPNRFATVAPPIEAFRVPARGPFLRVIGARDGQLVTDLVEFPATIKGDHAVADPGRDLLKIAVINRYAPAPPAIGFIRGFGLTRGAIAGSVAHDSHNIVAVGADDASLARAVAALVDAQGGLAIVDGDTCDTLPLEVAGLMSRDGEAIAVGYARLDAAARRLGSTLGAPYMTLSFMALLVIPRLKLSDRGLFDGETFAFTDLFKAP
ncbi:MAG: adenine deaminase [Gemmataceae bacterium]|nr:adenine deaminase [Gemmataceae bacterium]